ncbi:MAG: hypothetical protein AAF004_02330 [Pseudomonadota bacterium]
MLLINHVFRCVLLLLLAITARAQTTTDASQFVTAMQLGKSFYALSEKTAVRTTLYQALVDAVGDSSAQALMQEHLARAVEQRQDVWNDNLLSAYRAHLTDAQLLSIANQGKASPHAAVFLESRKRVSDDMQVMSADLLLETVAEGLNAALSAASASEPESESTQP